MWISLKLTGDIIQPRWKQNKNYMYSWRNKECVSKESVITLKTAIQQAVFFCRFLLIPWLPKCSDIDLVRLAFGKYRSIFFEEHTVWSGCFMYTLSIRNLTEINGSICGKRHRVGILCHLSLARFAQMRQLFWL